MSVLGIERNRDTRLIVSHGAELLECALGARAAVREAPAAVAPVRGDGLRAALALQGPLLGAPVVGEERGAEGLELRAARRAVCAREARCEMR